MRKVVVVIGVEMQEFNDDLHGPCRRRVLMAIWP